MKYISSKDNQIYKSALKLTRKKFRDERDCFLLEGIKQLKEAGKCSLQVETVFVRESSQIDEDQIQAHRTFMLSDDLFNTLSDTTNSQGVVAVVKKPRQRLGDKSIVLLDRLQDPGNIGTIIRTAEAAGYSGIGIIKGTADIYSPKVTRAAAGALMRMPVVFFESGRKAAEILKQEGKRIAVTCLEEAVDYRDADYGDSVALIIGNEGTGVSRELMDEAEIRVTIPMEGSIESLNAAVAAGILMYESRKNR